MKKTKAFIIILITAIFITGFFVSCSTTTKKNNKTETTTETKTETTTESKKKVKTKKTTTFFDSKGDVESIEIIDQEVIEESEEKETNESDVQETSKTEEKSNTNIFNSWRYVIGISTAVFLGILLFGIWARKKLKL